MMILSVELHDFKSYRDATLHFLPGTNAILGANGAGKSTILEAIGFALFDYQPPGFKLANLLREGAATGSVVVRLVSSLDERPYDVERIFSATTTTRYRVYDPELGGQCIAEGNEEVRLWLHDHLRVDRSARLAYLFENTVGVPQGTNTAPFQQPAGARKAVFDPLLQVDDYRKASDNLRATENYLRDRHHEVQREIARIEGRLADLPRLQEEKDTLERMVTDLHDQTRRLGVELASLTGQLETMDAAERHVNKLAAQLERARADLSAHRLRLDDARRALREAEEAREQVEASRAGHEAYEAAENRLRDLEERRAARDALRDRLAVIEREEDRLETEIARLNEEMARIEELQRRISELAPAVKQQADLEEALRRAEEDVQRMEAAARREKQAADEAHRAHQELEATREGMALAADLEREIADQQTRLDELVNHEQEVREQGVAAKAECERLERQSSTLEEADTARCPVCEAELTPEHRRDLLMRNKDRITELNATMDRLRREIRTLQRDARATRAALEESQNRLRHLPTDEALQAAGERLAHRQAAWDEAVAELASLQGAPAAAEQYRRELSSLGDPRREYQLHEDRVRGRDDIAQRQHTAATRREALAADAGDLREQLAAYADLDDAVQAARQKQDTHLAAHQSYMTHLNVAGQYAARQALVDKLSADLEGLIRRATDAEHAHADAATNYDVDRHRQLREKVSDMRDELTRADARLSTARERRDEVEAAIADLEQAANEMAVRQNSLEELTALHSILRSTRQLLRQAGPYVTQHLVYQISKEASAIHADIMDDHTGRLNWSEDYDLSLEVRGHERNFRQFSGGEQMSAALALRLALLREISAVDVAFFDEPTAHLDPERRDGLAEKIMQVRGFSQVFVISHDDTFERAAQHHIRIIKDEGGSRPEGI
ncbi:MAG TPA: SMC family ATPase [Chloroflexi bacterium]|jgi:exonuclease SbcC|nr:SMC family ATPase [Chloroflexota bacterium]